MKFIYPFLITFSLIFFSELGDKTQLLVLSFSTKSTPFKILSGVALGTFCSHGIAILFGSTLGQLENDTFTFYLKLFTYITFILFGILGFLSNNSDDTDNKKSGFINKLSSLSLNYTFIVAISIIEVIGKF